MRPETLAAVAEAIADNLFTNGFGEVAARLVLESESGPGIRARDLGGWNRAAVLALIRRHLRLAIEAEG